MAKLQKNQFFNINKFPKGWGIIILPISMSRIETGQSPTLCIDWLLEFGLSKVTEPKIGIQFLYTDTLYMHSYETAGTLKELFMIETIKHKNALQKLIQRNKNKLQIQHAFQYQNWSSLYLQSRDFDGYFRSIKKLYKEDTKFQKFMMEDISFFDREDSDNQVNFFLEEFLASYLLIYRQVNLQNEYVMGREDWLLMVYPGIPPKTLVYLLQANPFNLDTNNPYIGEYDPESKIYYDFNNFDLDTWNYA